MSTWTYSVFTAYSVEAQAPEVQGKNVSTRELNTSAHQKHELRRRLQSGKGPVWSGAVQ